MNVQGPAPAVFRALVTGTATPPAQRPAAPPAATRPAAAVPQESSLWEVLTDEERAYFTQQAQLGSVTYRRGSTAAPAPAAPVGQRLDVRG